MLKFPVDYVVVLDLDDTIYKEVDFLISAYKRISSLLKPEIGHEIFDEMYELYTQKHSTFDIIKAKYHFNMSISEMVDIYRYHIPDIKLTKKTKNWLDKLKTSVHGTCLITDGRSISQRNKLKALSLEGFFNLEIISEEFGSQKPSKNNFLAIQNHFLNSHKFMYIADNLSKDFIAPNQLKWETICLLDNGSNIHPQTLPENIDYHPKYFIHSLSEIEFG